MMKWHLIHKNYELSFETNIKKKNYLSSLISGGNHNNDEDF